MRASSPSPDVVPSVAVKPADLSTHNDGKRSVSSASTMSHGSATTDASSLLSLGTAGRDPRDSLGSETSSSGVSRQSSGSYSSSLSPSTSSNRLSTGSTISIMSTISTGSTITVNSTGNPNGEQRHTKRRGYMRPTGTDFAASARSRESVLSLGSIAHLQHYFARTGLLDLKGQLERKRRGGRARTLDLTQVEGTSSYTGPRKPPVLSLSTDTDSSYASMGNSPDLSASGGGMYVESPMHVGAGDDWYGDDYDETDPAAMLPPTVSTYMNREKPLPKPPSQAELKAELQQTLDTAAAALAEAAEAKASQRAPATPTAAPPPPPSMAAPNPDPQNAGAKAAVAAWYEIQGMHILDVITLAIRAAKVYYTCHEDPDRLDAIKAEREVRSELLGVMDVLKRMATRNFSGGARTEEIRNMTAWVNSLYAMLAAEEVLIAAERKEQETWTWLKDELWPADASPESGDPARAYAREIAFLQTIMASVSQTEDKVDTVLPAWVPMDRSTTATAVSDTDTETAGTDTAPPSPTTTTPPAPTAFLQHMRNGVTLIQLHNCAVRKSRRRFGAIPTFHADTLKPYRAADNLRYWVKAAELRWDIFLKVDALGVVCNSQPDVWPAFEDAIYNWCRKVREEITTELV